MELEGNENHTLIEIIQRIEGKEQGLETTHQSMNDF